jgi:DNA-binding HxlR family transcriptional regulator
MRIVKVSDLMRRSKGPEILFALVDGPRYMTDLQRAVGGSATTVEERVSELLGEGLIEEEKMSTVPFRRTFNLTGRGAEVADSLRRMYGMLNRELPERRYAILIAILNKLGEVRSRTRLEKLVFLLENELDFNFVPSYSFLPNKIGPYSGQLVSDAREMGRLNIIEEEEVIHPPLYPDGREVVQYVYRITPQAETMARTIYDGLDSDSKEKIAALKKYNEMPLKVLLDYVHGKWPDLKT